MPLRSTSVGRVACAVVAVAALGLARPAAGAVEAVSVRTDDGATLVATLHTPTRLPAPGVVLVHMQNRARGDWEAFASRLSAAGFVALTFDLRGYGDSAGGRTGAAANVADVRACIRYLLGRRDIVSDIGVAGASMGANLALLAAGSEPIVRSLALLSPGMDILGVRIEPALRDYALRPILLLAGRDDYYAMRSCGSIVGQGSGIREFQVVEGSAHGTMMLSRNPETAEILLDWFRRTLL